MQVFSLSLLFLPSVFLMSSSPRRGSGDKGLSILEDDEMCWNKAIECISTLMPCWLRCRGYTSGICINAPECRNPGYIWKCKCWGKEKDVETLGECDAWEEYQKKEVMARKLEHLAKTITHGSMSIR